MNINGLLKVAEKNKFIPTQKRFSLEFSPAKKLPKTQVNPEAIRALIEKKERERRDERANLISKAVESTKRDEVNYKDRNGLRKAEQERTEKCKKQWQKVQKDRREFIEHMNRSADKRDQTKKARDSQEVIKSIKSKEQEKDKRKRKYETFVGSTEPAKKVKYTPTVAPKVADINELMRLAQKNAEEKSFGTIVNPLRELEKKQPPALAERLLTQSEKKRLAEQEALSKRRDLPSIPRIPKVGQSSESHKTNKHKKLDNDNRKESSKSSKEKVREKNHPTLSGNHSSSSAGSSGAGSGSSGNSRDKHEKPRDKKHSSEKDRSRTSHNGSSSSKSNGVSKPATVAQPPTARKPTSTPVTPNGSLGKPQNGNVAVQSMSSSAKDKLREEMAKKLAQLQRERQAEEEEERRKRLQAKKARLAKEEHIKKKLRALQHNQTRMDSEDDEDFDEDLDEYEDDFIDDGPVDDPYAKGYSKHIKEIFNYDKTKYRDMDDDDIEESSFTRCMAEEARSARLGRQEDLEDMRKEAEENRKKDSRSKALKDLSEKLKQKKKLTLCPV